MPDGHGSRYHPEAEVREEDYAEQGVGQKEHKLVQHRGPVSRLLVELHAAEGEENTTDLAE